jgi:hypothetical protein
MIKCPFCAFDNEDGALFCEQCKSDLGGVEAAIPAAIPMAEPAPPVAEPMSAGMPPTVSPLETVPLAAASPAPAVPEPPPVAAVAAPVELAAAAPAAPAEAAAAGAFAATPKLLVIRGLKMNVTYPVYQGENFIGRSDEKPVDIDLDDQEAPDRVWSSRQHAVIIFNNGEMTIEDLNSANGTFVNRNRVYPGQKQALKPNDVVQVGTVQMRVQAE